MLLVGLVLSFVSFSLVGFCLFISLSPIGALLKSSGIIQLVFFHETETLFSFKFVRDRSSWTSCTGVFNCDKIIFGVCTAYIIISSVFN